MLNLFSYGAEKEIIMCFVSVCVYIMVVFCCIYLDNQNQVIALIEISNTALLSGKGDWLFFPSLCLSLSEHCCVFDATSVLEDQTIIAWPIHSALNTLCM